ncbi:hypothetical protein M3J09_004551 [Ascochyta lentis]
MTSHMQDLDYPNLNDAKVHVSTPDNKRVTETNRSFVLSPSKTFSFEDRPLPQLLSRRHVRIRVVATGLCGSDVSSFSYVLVLLLDRQQDLTEVNHTARSITGNTDALADT